MTTETWPGQIDATFTIADFEFSSGETLAELHIGYMTIGQPVRNDHGRIVNAVLLLHNTTGARRTWLEPWLANELFGDGQPLDAGNHYLIIPDLIGFGESSKPSDGLRARFPAYRYADMVSACHRLLTEDLDVDHLRLVLGLSMGGMLTWMWGETYPYFQDALVPLASLPGPMSGRNWVQRRVAIEAIRNDPGWNGGDYDANPTHYTITAPFNALMLRNVARLQELAPTRADADKLYAQFAHQAARSDANDHLYRLEASMDYDPEPDLDKIRSPLLVINFADDEINPPELGVVERALPRLPTARYVLVPASEASEGHYSALRADQWKHHLAEFLATLPPPD